MKLELRSALAFLTISVTALTFWYLFRKLIGYMGWRWQAISLLLSSFLIIIEVSAMYAFGISSWPSYEISWLLAGLIFGGMVILLMPLGIRLFKLDYKNRSFKYVFIGTSLLSSACILAYLTLAEFR